MRVTAEPVNRQELRDARARAREQLAAAFAEDLIGADELDRRLDALADAASPRAIAILTADLAPSLAMVPAGSAPHGLARPDDVPLSSEISAVLGEASRRGVWMPARDNTVRAIFASVELDLREAVLAPGETVFDVSVVFAELVFVVPPGLRVVSDLSVFVASLEEDDDRTQPYGPSTIRIVGQVVFGQVEVSRRRPGETKRQARRRRKAERKQLEAAARRRALPPGATSREP